MALKPGTQLGPYEITAPIGAGGMGEVYRATDTNLERDVAIKVLPDDVARDRERLARFEREAKILASLNHPNIAHIYGLEEADGVKALILELVEGPTLADRIAQGPLSLEEALPIAKQVTEALEAAHGQGIIHRDLKPANVKVKSDGTVKVLDFGLAKAVLPEVTDSDPSASPTLTAATQLGVVLGTAAYMAPEQARGKPVDKRADIWAFGVVLFEMLSGRRPFVGKDVSGTLAKVIEREPEWRALPNDVPLAVRAFLERCLAKDPRQRIHDIADVRLAIEGAFDVVLQGGTASADRIRFWQRPSVIGLMALASVSTAALLTWHLRPGGAERGAVLRYTIPAPPESHFRNHVEAHNLALSPDGRRLAFVAQGADGIRRLWLRHLGRDEAEPLAGTDEASSPFWSPDGRWLAFFTRSDLSKLRPGAGPPEVVCSIQGNKSGTWGRGDVIVFAVGYGEARGAYRVDAGGGEPIRLEDDEDQLVPYWPVFLPGGERFLYTAYRRTGTDEGVVPHLHVGSLSSSVTRPLFRVESRVGVAPGHLIYVEQGILLARPFDFEGLRFTGDAVPLGADVPQFVTASAPFAVSRSGVIAYGSRRRSPTRLTWRDRAGRELGTLGEPDFYGGSMELSPDETKLAFVMGDGTDRDVWIYDLERGFRTRLTSSPGLKGDTVWSPEGTRIAYSRHGPKVPRNGVFVSTLAGGEEVRLDAHGRLPGPSAWSRDGKWIAVTQGAEATGADVWLLPMTGEGDPFPRFQTRFHEWGAVFSPDGKWLAYGSDESGTEELYVAPVEGTHRGVRVSTNELWGQAFWRDDGEELFYQTDDGVMAVPIRDREGAPVPGEPTLLFSNTAALKEAALKDVTGDGQRFLVGERTSEYTLRMIVNWTDGLDPSR